MGNLAARMTITRMSDTLLLLELSRLAREAPASQRAALSELLQLEITMQRRDAAETAEQASSTEASTSLPWAGERW